MLVPVHQNALLRKLKVVSRNMVVIWASVTAKKQLTHYQKCRK